MSHFSMVGAPQNKSILLYYSYLLFIEVEAEISEMNIWKQIKNKTIYIDG